MPAASPAAALPSPSPGLPFASPSALPASPVPSPSASPSPSPRPFSLARFPFAVMIDNIIEARPHSGLDAADVVYEAPAEGGIPRLMPVYLRGGADRIGPVRSARDYFVALANEYGVALVHIGASPSGFEMLERTGIVRVDESRGDGGFTRDPRRQAPHNAYVSADAVRADLQSRGAVLKPSTGGLVWNGYQAGSQPATSVRIAYPGGERYVVQYGYNPDSKTYARTMDGQPHVDAVTGRGYIARSILVQYVPVAPIPGDDAGRLDVTLTGSGKAVLIAEGTQVPLTWNRANVFQSTRYRREDGKPFSLPEGQVWIQIVPLETSVAIS